MLTRVGEAGARIGEVRLADDRVVIGQRLRGVPVDGEGSGAQAFDDLALADDDGVVVAVEDRDERRVGGQLGLRLQHVVVAVRRDAVHGQPPGVALERLAVGPPDGGVVGDAGRRELDDGVHQRQHRERAAVDDVGHGARGVVELGGLDRAARCARRWCRRRRTGSPAPSPARWPGPSETRCRWPGPPRGTRRRLSGRRPAAAPSPAGRWRAAEGFGRSVPGEKSAMSWCLLFGCFVVSLNAMDTAPASKQKDRRNYP